MKETPNQVTQTNTNSAQNLINTSFDERLKENTRTIGELRDGQSKIREDHRDSQYKTESKIQQLTDKVTSLIMRFDEFYVEQKKTIKEFEEKYLLVKDYNRDVSDVKTELSKISQLLESKEREEKEERSWFKKEIWGNLISAAVGGGAVYLVSRIFT